MSHSANPESLEQSDNKKKDPLHQFDVGRFQNMIIHSPDILFLNRDGRIIYVNPTAVRLLRAPSEDSLIGRTPLDFFHPSQHDAILSRIELLRTSPCMAPVVEETMMALDGSLLEVEVFASSFYTGEHLDIQVVCRDITERKAYESKLARQAALLDNARDAIIVRDLENRIRYWNKGAQKIYGWSREEALGQNLQELLQTSEEAYEELSREVLDVGEWMGELYQKSREGEALTVLARWSVLYDNDGAPESVLVINTNVTELKKMEEQFLRAQRLESIGRLAGGIAHDLNNVLAPILMSFELLENEIISPEGRATLAIVQSSARHGKELVKQVLGFARGSMGSTARINPIRVAKDIHQVVTDTFPKSIETSLTFDEGTWDVSADPTQLHQVLMNLCVNARDAMPGGGRLDLTVQNIIVDEIFPESEAQTKPGIYVAISVEDSGNGMPKSVQKQIFEPFFTTKDLGEGTGLGLSTVHTIVKNLGGFINLYSELGRGTTFKVYLPAFTDTVEANKTTNLSAPCPRGNGELILLVDDEESIREVARKALEAFGYRVLLASNGAEGVSLFLQHKGEVDLVLTDMNMPIMDGPSMIVALQSLDPEVRVVGSSGLSSNGGVARALGVGVEHFVPKPYRAEVLLKSLHKALHGSTGMLNPAMETVKNPTPNAENSDLVDSHSEAEVSGRTKIVLFVDDEPSLCKLGKAILTKAGFSVFIADDAFSALTTLQQHQGEIDVLISDVNMPGMNGFSLAEKVVQEYPLVKIILSSGDPNTASEEGCNEKFSFKTLNKPYSVRELTSVVEDVLSGAEEPRGSHGSSGSRSART